MRGFLMVNASHQLTTQSLLKLFFYLRVDLLFLADTFFTIAYSASHENGPAATVGRDGEQQEQEASRWQRLLQAA